MVREREKNCLTCSHFDIETIYGVCDIYGILNEVEENCKSYEEEKE